eukprot:1801595-Pyramimonas_sp.AAC.1
MPLLLGRRRLLLLLWLEVEPQPPLARRPLRGPLSSRPLLRRRRPPLGPALSSVSRCAKPSARLKVGLARPVCIIDPVEEPDLEGSQDFPRFTEAKFWCPGDPFSLSFEGHD